MTNRDLQAAWTYHNETKHSLQSVRSGPRGLDWDNQPLPFKIYRHLEPIPLPRHLSSSGVPALEAIAGTGTGAGVPSLQTLAEILYLSAGITKRKAYPGGEILFRAASCTGALYHVDLYLICAEIPELAAGVYHFSPEEFALRRLRAGDYRGALARIAGGEPAVASAPVTVASASTFWRNAWKYRARAYRHCFWDNGTILANLLAAATARDVAARVVLGFADRLLGRLLGLDAEREGTLSLVALGRGAPVPGEDLPIEPLELETVPLSGREIDYPSIRTMHEASSLQTEEEVIAWRKEALEKRQPAAAEEEKAPAAPLIPLRPLAPHEIAGDSIEEVVQRRGSTRRFARDSIGFPQLSTMLERATRGIPSDFSGPGEPLLNSLYLIVHAVEDLAPGSYVYHRHRAALEPLKRGDFRSEAGYLGLGQELPADASVNVYFLTDLDRQLERYGNRGYRAAQLEAGIMGGKLYLAAYAQRLGASGLTFFDDDVTEFFAPHAAGKSVMFLIALGRSWKPRHG